MKGRSARGGRGGYSSPYVSNGLLLRLDFKLLRFMDSYPLIMNVHSYGWIKNVTYI